MNRERLLEVLLAYITDDEEEALEHDYVLEKLVNVCGLSKKELNELGYEVDEMVDEFDEEEDPDFDDPFLEVGFDPYLGCYSDDC